LGLLIASNDLVAADSLCAQFFGFNPKSISHIKKASEKGLENMRFQIISDLYFDIRKYRLKFSTVLFHLIRIDLKWPSSSSFMHQYISGSVADAIIKFYPDGFISQHGDFSP
jgi:hypothetical protein